MDPTRITRREVVKRGAVVSLFVAIGGLDAASRATSADAMSMGTVNGGVFVRAIDSRSAVVNFIGLGELEVVLEPTAYVHHGADEAPLADLTTFVPGERVAVRGGIAGQTLTAKEVQSVYTEEVGSLRIDSAEAATLEAIGGGTLDAPGGPVRVPAYVQAASGNRPTMQSGETATATIWTHPGTGQRTAVLLTPAA